MNWESLGLIYLGGLLVIPVIVGFGREVGWWVLAEEGWLETTGLALALFLWPLTALFVAAALVIFLPIKALHRLGRWLGALT